MSLTKLKNEILPLAFDKDGNRFIGCELDVNFEAEDQFASNVVLVTVIVEKNNDKNKIPVIIKFEPSNLNVRQYSRTGNQFYNEVFMYSNVLPYLEKANTIEDLFPDFLYGIGLTDDSDKNVIIIKDLSLLGYRLTETRSYLDYEHLALALNKLGKFHALSYAAKEKSKEEFIKIASRLKETFCWKENIVIEVAKACFHRAIDPLLKQGKHVELLQEFLKVVDDRFLPFLLELVSPKDPLAVICHGDFCRNNMLFKYTDENPMDVKFFDIATSRLASPVIDISFFLLLNSSRELRNVHWYHLLEIYHKSLSSAVPGTRVPSLGKIKEAIKEKALWGFVHCSFFLLPMHFGCHLDIDAFSTMTKEEMVSTFLSHGGEAGTKLLSDIVEELIERKCLSLDHT